MSEKKKMTQDFMKLLQQQEITAEAPGRILREIEKLIEFLQKQEKVLVSTSLETLPQSLLPEINALLEIPVLIESKRPIQKSYPHIHGLYLLLRTTGLVLVEPRGKKKFLVFNPAGLSKWKSLNPTEQYFSLLSWTVPRGVDKIIEEETFQSTFFKGLSLSDRLKGKELTFSSHKEQQKFHFADLYQVALLELFGIISIQHSKKPEKTWHIKQLAITPFGDILYQLFATLFHTHYFFVGGYEMQIEQFKEKLSPFFPQWKNTLFRELEVGELQEKDHLVKVSFNEKVWRKIIISAEENLDQLSTAILNAFDFDHEHLYCFTFRNEFREEEEFYDPRSRSQEGYDAETVRIGELRWAIGQSLGYEYDFGHSWRFTVVLEKLLPPDQKRKNAEVIEEKGKAPKQHSSWKDEDEGEW